METLGKALGVNKSTIQRYESKGIDPKKNYIPVSVADALDTTVEWLTGLNDERELDISTRLQKTIDKHISAFIKNVTESVPYEQHQELMADCLLHLYDNKGGALTEMFEIRNNAQKELKK